MKHTLNKLSDSKIKINITLEAKDLSPIVKDTVKKLGKDIKVAGFRPGKVPADVAAKNIDPNTLNSNVLEEAVNHFTNLVLTDAKITPLDRPNVDVKKYVPEQSAEFVVELEVLPEIKLGDYKKLKAIKEKVSVTDKDVTELLDRLRQNSSTKEDVKRAAKNGDEVVIDFHGTDKDGKDVAGASGKDYPLVLGSNTFIPGFEEGLVGKKAGDSVDLELTFPKDYHHKPLAGAKVKFATTVKSVKEVKLPELDDAFAKKVAGVESVADLKKDAKRELLAQKEREAADKLKDSLIEQLVESSKVPVPEVLIKDQVASLERDFTQNLIYRGMTLDQYLSDQGKTKDEWRDSELRDQAIRRIKVGLVLSELTKAEDVDITEDELNAKLAEFLSQYPDPKMQEQFDTPEARRSIANRVLTEKTVDRLVELNTK